MGFEPTPFTTGALNQRLRPLGHAIGYFQVQSKPEESMAKIFLNKNMKFTLAMHKLKLTLIFKVYFDYSQTICHQNRVHFI